MKSAKPNSMIASQPCSSGHITADKRLRYTSLKLPLATSFIRKTLCAIRKPAFYGKETVNYDDVVAFV